jgi:hypothetical protein
VAASPAVVCLAVVTLALAVVTAWALVRLTQDDDQKKAAIPAPSNGGPPPVVSSPVPTRGTITAMGDQEGVDLDTGAVMPQNDPGADISGSGDTSDLTAVSSAAEFADAGAGTVQPSACDAPTLQWSPTLKTLYTMPVGNRICVRTSEGKLAMIVLRATPSAAEQSLTFDWATWNR